MGKQRRRSWRTGAALLAAASIGCQTMIHADRSLIPDGGGGAGGGQTGEESDAGPDGGVIVLGGEAEVTEQSDESDAGRQ